MVPKNGTQRPPDACAKSLLVEGYACTNRGPLAAHPKRKAVILSRQAGCTFYLAYGSFICRKVHQTVVVSEVEII